MKSFDLNEIVQIGERYVFLQQLVADVDENGEPIASLNNHYVGYECSGAEDTTPIEGEQPGRTYPTATPDPQGISF